MSASRKRALRISASKVAQALADRHPADELQARLLIMEQSLIALQRFLGMLQRDLEDALGIQHYQTQKRIRDRRKAVRSESLEQASDRFASQATAAVLAPDENVDTLGSIAKAMRPLSGRR